MEINRNIRKLLNFLNLESELEDQDSVYEEIKKRISTTDKTKIYKWFKVRLKKEEVKIFYE